MVNIISLGYYWSLNEGKIHDVGKFFHVYQIAFQKGNHIGKSFQGKELNHDLRIPSKIGVTRFYWNVSESNINILSSFQDHQITKQAFQKPVWRTYLTSANSSVRLETIRIEKSLASQGQLRMQ